ncbi:putative serine esterase (DUF676) [Novymonas esmeraldas]|uniref:Serine esterase (DUF676) n=1 Tax=Novymonas esmeraldas TaxID=1808958 RepID=A0AAW0EN56_9TRYP
MLRGLLQWCASPSVSPQDAFKRVHGRLGRPAALPAGRTHAAGDSTAAAAAPPLRVVDPYHFILCQHGMLGSAADFDGVLVDLFVHHEVSVLEAVETAEAAAAAAVRRGEQRRTTHGHPPSPPPVPFGAAAAAAAQHVNSSSTTPSFTPESGECAAVSSLDVGAAYFTQHSPTSTAPTASRSTTNSAVPTRSCVVQESALEEAPLATAAMRAAAAAQQQQQQQQQRLEQAWLSASTTAADGVRAERVGGVESGSAPDHRATTADQRARRAAYKVAYRLAVEHPNQHGGRLYRSGNLQCFSPGSNEYMRTDAGTLACARRALAEVVPALHRWLDEVESQEKQRLAQWAVYARACGTREAAWQAAEAAATPLPVCLSFTAHSFGGIIQRELLYLLLVETPDMRGDGAGALDEAVAALRQRLRRLHVTFENFVSVATPHCGAGECLWWPIYFGAWCLARMRLCRTYDELLLSDAERVLQHRLVDEPHLRTLEVFRRRVLFANTHRDILVGFGTCSLIFEGVDTDHTKFIGVAPHTAHCAPAFADHATEVSRPILLHAQAETSGRAGGVALRHTMDALDAAAAAADAVELSVGERRSQAMQWRGEHVGAEGDGHPVHRDAALLCKAPAALIIGHSAHARAGEPVSVHDVAASCVDDTDSDFGSTSASSTVTSVLSQPFSLLRSRGGSGAWSTPLLLHRFASGGSSVGADDDSCGGWTAGTACGGCSRSSATSTASSRRASSSIGAVTAVLRDPRWASEHVRRAATTVHATVARRLWTSEQDATSAPTTPPVAAARAVDDIGSASASATTSATTSSSATSLCETQLLPSVVLQGGPVQTAAGAEVDLPLYRQAPRAIAARLRRRMSWRVRAVRLDNVIPAGHVACLGNWTFCGRSPTVVQAVAEEMLIIL